MASVVIADLLIRSFDLRAFYTDFGTLPRSVLLRKLPNDFSLSFHMIGGNSGVQATLFGVAALCAFGLLVGFRTRLMSVLTFFLTASLHSRNPLILQNGDFYLRMMLFWGMFVPLGASCSIDRFRWRGNKPEPQVWTSMGTLALLAQTVIVYLCSAFEKGQGSDWIKDGTAVFYTLNLSGFVTPIGRQLLLFPFLCKVLTFAIVLFEAVAPLAMFIPIGIGPIRTLIVFLFIFMHLSFATCLYLGPFPWVSAAALTVFLPPWFWEHVSFIFEGFWSTTRTKTMGICAKTLSHFSSFETEDIYMHHSFFSESVVVLVLMCVIYWNVNVLNPDHHPVPKIISTIIRISQSVQSWAMFAPNPHKTSGWFVIPGKLKNGKLIDVYQHGKALSWAPPASIAGTYPNERWRKYLMNLEDSKNQMHRVDFGRYLCWEWNASHVGEEQLDSFEIFTMTQTNLTAGKLLLYHPRSLGKMYCFTVPPKTQNKTTTSMPSSRPKGAVPNYFMDSPYAP